MSNFFFIHSNVVENEVHATTYAFLSNHYQRGITLYKNWGSKNGPYIKLMFWGFFCFRNRFVYDFFLSFEAGPLASFSSKWNFLRVPVFKWFYLMKNDIHVAPKLYPYDCWQAYVIHAFHMLFSTIKWQDRLKRKINFKTQHVFWNWFYFSIDPVIFLFVPPFHDPWNRKWKSNKNDLPNSIMKIKLAKEFLCHLYIQGDRGMFNWKSFNIFCGFSL